MIANFGCVFGVLAAARDAPLTWGGIDPGSAGQRGLASGPPECRWVLLLCGCARKPGAGY